MFELLTLLNVKVRQNSHAYSLAWKNVPNLQKKWFAAIYINIISQSMYAHTHWIK